MGHRASHQGENTPSTPVLSHICAPFLTLQSPLFCLNYQPEFRAGATCVFYHQHLPRVLFSSVAQLCSTLCNPVDCCTPGHPVHHQLLEFTQIHVHRVGDAIPPSHPLSSPSPPAFNLSQHQGLFKRVSSSHQVTKILELQFQHQSFQ